MTMFTGNEEFTGCKLLPVQGSSSCHKQIVWHRTKYKTVFLFRLSLTFVTPTFWALFQLISGHLNYFCTLIGQDT